MDNYRVFISDWEWGKQVTIISKDAVAYLRFHINNEEPEVAHFTIVEVDEERRRHGLCKDIWNRAEIEAKNLGCSTIIGYAKQDGVAFGWYLKTGMQIEGDKDEKGYYKLIKHI